MEFLFAFAAALAIGYIGGSMATAHWLNWRAYQRLEERMSKRK